MRSAAGSLLNEARHPSSAAAARRRPWHAAVLLSHYRDRLDLDAVEQLVRYLGHLGAGRSALVIGDLADEEQAGVRERIHAHGAAAPVGWRANGRPNRFRSDRS